MIPFQAITLYSQPPWASVTVWETSHGLSPSTVAQQKRKESAPAHGVNAAVPPFEAFLLFWPLT